MGLYCIICHAPTSPESLKKGLNQYQKNHYQLTSTKKNTIGQLTVQNSIVKKGGVVFIYLVTTIQRWHWSRSPISRTQNGSKTIQFFFCVASPIIYSFAFFFKKKEHLDLIVNLHSASYLPRWWEWTTISVYFWSKFWWFWYVCAWYSFIGGMIVHFAACVWMYSVMKF